MPQNATAIPPSRLTAIRAEAAAQPRSQFVDPRQMRQVQDIVQRRGERWLAAILGRDLSRRSLISSAFPWLYEGELHAIVLADLAEDAAIALGIAAASITIEETGIVSLGGEHGWECAGCDTASGLAYGSASSAANALRTHLGGHPDASRVL